MFIESHVRFALHRLTAPLVAVSLLSSACTLAPEPGDDAPIDRETGQDTGQDTGHGGGCPPEECGTNGVVLADRRFSPIDLDGGDNGSGLVLVGAIDRTGREFALDVIGSRFAGRSWDTGALQRTGEDLVGASLLLTRSAGSGEESSYVLTIKEMTSLSYFSNQPGVIPAYRMTYASAEEPGQEREICPDGGSLVLTTGERYDARSLAVAPANDRWLELACQHHLLGKAKRMSYDPGTPAGDRYYTTAAQRRATLAMLAADYCGDGQRFTAPGTPLVWRNRADWMVIGSAPTWDSDLEAGWDRDGAVCLNTPRQADVYWREDIEATCGRILPTCTPELLAASEWVTWRAE